MARVAQTGGGREPYWRLVVARWKHSALSVRTFCGAEGLNPSRSRDGPSQFLNGFRGFLQADAFGGYDGIYSGGLVVEVGCNAHARRRFTEAQKSDAALSRSTGVLS
jgi:Transposase IS66 family